MTYVNEIAHVLGLRPPDSPFQLMSAVGHGLPLGALDHLVALVAPGDAGFKYRLVPKASLARRKQDDRLTADQSERLARIARVWSAAADVWGSDDEARRFLFRPHAMLDDHRPIDVAIGSEMGADLVDDILGRLRYGSAA